MPAPLPAFGETFVSSVDETARRITITSASAPLVLTQGSAPADAVGIPTDYDVVIRADRAVVRGNIRMPGRSFTLHARVVEAENGASISTSGNAAAAPPPPAPIDPFQPQAGQDYEYSRKGGDGSAGKAGQAGRAGSAGGAAGSITIHASEFRGARLMLEANGGNGGQGQGGQAAVGGGRGGNGGRSEGNPDHNPAGDGGNGGAGADGGAGGDGGVGGAAGAIDVRALTASSLSLVQATANAGQGGAGGAGGAAGPGGAAGRPGAYSGGREPKPGTAGKDGVNGRTGTNGAAGGSAIVTVKGGANSELSAGVTAAHLQMVLRLASLRMLLGFEDRDELAAMLSYVMNVSAARRNDAQFDAAWRRANALLFQIARGVDFQGQPSNYAPRLDIATYRRNLDAFVESFHLVRDEHRKYFAAESSRETRLTGLAEIRRRAVALVNDLDTQSKEALATATWLIRLIDSTQRECSAKYQTWREKLVAFEKTLTDKAREIGCPLDSLNKLVKGLDVLTLSGDARAKTAAGIGHKVEDFINGVVPDELKPAAIENAVKKLDTLGNDLKDLANAYKQNESLILDQADPHSYKILVDQKQLDKILEPYLDRFGSAKELKQAMDDYVKLVQARNEVILQFNEQIAGLAAIKARRAEAEAQRISAESLISAGADPLLPELATFAGNVFHASKQLCVDQLYLTWKAAVFYSLDRGFDVFQIIRDLGAKTDLDWTAFEAGKNAVIKHLQDAEEHFGADVTPFPRADDKGEGVIITIDDPASLAALKTDRRLTIRVEPSRKDTSLTANPFAGMADVRVKRARVWIKGAKTDDKQLTVYFTQNGRETIVDIADRPLDFVHKEVQTRLRYDYETRDIKEGGDIRLDDSKYAAVGPFGSWRIHIDPTENRNLDLSNVTEVKLEFHVTHRLFRGKGFRGEAVAGNA